MSDDGIALLTGTDAIPSGCARAGLLFECAPDSAAQRCASRVVPLSGLVGEFEDAKRMAFALATKLLANEPPLRSIRQLGIFEEIVIRELQRAFHAIRLQASLESGGCNVCRVMSSSSTIDGLRALQRLDPRSCRLQEAGQPAVGAKAAARVARVLKRVRGAGFSAGALGAEWQQVLNRVDPYHRRAAWLRKGGGALSRGGIWFYSTAYTFTRAGMMYEPYFPERFTWLVENPRTGGAPLDEASRDYVDVYGLGSPSFRPSAGELRRSCEAVVRHLEAVKLEDGEEELARQLFLRSAEFGKFLEVHLPKGLYLSALFESLLDAGRPRAVVVGNPVFEGYLLQQARQRQIPTLLLQHGILGDYCQFSDPPVDTYVVRGSFWRDFLAEAPRERAVVLNPPQVAAQVPVSMRSEGHVLFLSAPYSTQEFLNPLDLDEILTALLKAVEAHAAPLLVRVHPMESVGEYRKRIRLLARRFGCAAEVRFSQGAGLEDAVRGACVAVTYCSTVFLDCLRAGVPVVSFGWHDFSFRRALDAHAVFHYARTLAELERLVSEAIMRRLPPFAGGIGPFLADCGEAALREFFSSRLAPALREGAR